MNKRIYINFISPNQAAQYDKKTTKLQTSNQNKSESTEIGTQCKKVKETEHDHQSTARRSLTDLRQCNSV